MEYDWIVASMNLHKLLTSLGNRLAIHYNNKTYYKVTGYIAYQNGAWTMVNTTSDAAVFQKDTESFVSYFVEHTVMQRAADTTENATYTTNDTYFPLSWDTDDPTKTNSKNTGYVVSGSKVKSGDIRVSKYYVKDIYKAINTSSYYNVTFNASYDAQLEVLTANEKTSGNLVRISDSHNSGNSSVNSELAGYSKQTVTSLGFSKYEDSRNSLFNRNTGEGMFANTSDIYGLHFMDAEISSSSVVNIPKAIINEQEFTNYKMPTDCIDFTLKRSGYINFFAGSYFSNNNTFFSLHHIERNANGEIVSIKEISKIFNNTDEETLKKTPYIYYYSDGTYSVSDTDNVGSLVFNMKWVTSPTMVQNAVYYFEIPANTGEYALGSVSGKNGAYLMYLDIASSKKTVDKTIITENITTTTEEYSYLKGIDFASIKESDNDFSTVVGGNSANLIVKTGNVGTVTFVFTESDDETTLTFTNTSATKLGANFIDASLTLSGDDPPTATPENTKEVVVNRVTNRQYYNNDDSLLTTVTTTTTSYLNGVQQGQPQIVEGEPVSSEVHDFVATTTMAGTTNTVVQLHYMADPTANVSIELVYHPAAQDDDIFGTYEITITSDTDVVIYVDAVLAKHVATINGQTVQAGDKILISATTNP